jgi:hypothetical protein
MANENSVYSYETNFIAALESILDVALTQTVAFGDTTAHQAPRIEVGFTYGGAGIIDRGRTATGEQYLRKHNGTINLTVFGTVKSDHLALVGKVRTFMAWNVPTLISPALAYYQVQSLFEQAGSNEAGDEEGDFEISSELNFDVVFFIPTEAFDASNIIKFSQTAIYFGTDQLFYGD